MEKTASIGVDVSKLTLDIALYDDGEFNSKKNHLKVKNATEGYLKFYEWMTEKGFSKEHLHVCMEYTGLYCHDFRLWLEQEGIAYYMIKPSIMHNYHVVENIKGINRMKTDEVDSFRIASYCNTNYRKLTPCKLPSPAFFKIKRLLAERKQYVRHNVLYKQQLRDISKYDTDRSKARKQNACDFLDDYICRTDKEIDRILKADKQLKKNYDLLCSITGIGRVNALTTIVLTENFTAISNPRQYASYIAVSPFKKESGISVRRKEATDKQGFSQAKADLSIAILTAVKNDPQIKAYWKRKKEEGKPSGVVMNAIKFKLILRMFAVIRHQQTFIRMQ